jgi:hypothetical protein
MTEKSCPPLISFIPWLSDRTHERAVSLPPSLIATEPPRAPQGPGIPHAAAFGEPSFDLRVPIHRQLPPRHKPLPFVPRHNGTGLSRPQTSSTRVGPIPRNRVGLITGNHAPIESTISFSVRRKARANHSSDRDLRGLEERIVSVHAPIVAQHVPERHTRMDRESRDTVLN